MKLALLLVSALGTAPIVQAPLQQQQQQPPATAQRIVIKAGQGFICHDPAGCFVTNAAGIELLVREVSQQVQAQQCRGGQSL
jgi:hypothetical protein